MCMCFSDAPPDRSRGPKNKKDAMYFKYYDFANTWQITMMDAPCKGQPLCCIGVCPFCFPCVQFWIRKKALEQIGNGMQDYICSQGYYPACCCWQPGKMGEKSCPEVCLCLEGCCCPGCVLTGTRLSVMDAYQIQPDPCDNRFIQFNNCIQMLACICHMLAMIDSSFQDLANIIDCIADIVFFSMAGCMTAQAYTELEYQKANGAELPNLVGGYGGAAPTPQVMQHHVAPVTQAYVQQPPVVAAPPVVVAQAQPQQFMVTIPPGTPAGTQMTVQAPNGAMMSVQVPPGAPPGSQIMVQY